MNLHTKKCTEDSKERSESETLKVFPTFGKDEHVYRPIKYDFVLIDKCEAEKKVNLHLNVYFAVDNTQAYFALKFPRYFMEGRLPLKDVFH